METTPAPLFGWKIAATSEAGQRHINVDGPLAGRLLAERVIEEGATVSLATNLMRVAEVEFAFRFGADLPPRAEPYAVDEVMAAVAALHPAIELPDSRYRRFLCGRRPATHCGQCLRRTCSCSVPPWTADWRGIDLAAYEVSATVTGKGEHRWSGIERAW